MRSDQKFQRGFTLVEMVVVMVITGILGGMIAMLLRGPVQEYVDSARRAGMSDAADTALHRITRDVRLALPNSVRVTGACNGTGACYLEYLEMVAGGRYNNGASGVGYLTTVGDLVSGAAGFPSLALVNGRGTLGASAVVVVNNLGNSCAASSVYCGASAATVSGVSNGVTNPSEDVINFSPTIFSPSPNNRFQIVSQPVTYVCSPAAGGTGGTLTRYWGYAIQPGQPSDTASPPLASASRALLASNVSACSFSLSQDNGQVTMPLTITEQGESISLYGAAHVGSESDLYGSANGNVP